MKKVLILAYDFPPYVSVGALRPYSWFKYLGEFGVFPIVVTRQWSNKFGNHLDYVAASDSAETIVEEFEQGIILRTPYKPNFSNKLLLKYGNTKFKLFRKSVSAFFEFAQYLSSVGPKINLFFEADKYLKNNKVDVIIATGDPFVLFRYASLLSEKYNIPWIADYRDPWVQDKSVKNRLNKWFAYQEKKYLKNANKLLTVSTFMQKQITFNLKDKDFEIIPNGYDPDIINVIKGVKQKRDILSIAFAGTIYDWHPFESFIKTCKEIIKENPRIDLQLNFYGINKRNEVRELIDSKFEKFVNCYPKVPNLKLAKAIASQNACLLFNDYSILGTKIFDYLAIKRKIILCYENDPEANKLKTIHYHLDDINNESKSLQADLIKATNSGIIVRDSKHLKKVILDLNREFKENGYVKCESINVEEYSRMKQVSRLAEIVKKLCR